MGRGDHDMRPFFTRLPLNVAAGRKEPFTGIVGSKLG